MVSYKAIGAFSPILLYGCYDKMAISNRVRKEQVGDSNNVLKGIDIKFNEKSLVN